MREGMLVDISPIDKDAWISVIVHECSDDRIIFGKVVGREFFGLRVERDGSNFRSIPKEALLKVRKTNIEKIRNSRGLE